mmetsp:Transcript_2200/g.3665  ORF Transcript_2200/g.3665 Transcript_2200/m.3665 type:complete len:159 (+) Transcript_2200:179-655(+)
MNVADASTTRFSERRTSNEVIMLSMAALFVCGGMLWLALSYMEDKLLVVAPTMLLVSLVYLGARCTQYRVLLSDGHLRVGSWISRRVIKLDEIEKLESVDIAALEPRFLQPAEDQAVMLFGKGKSIKVTKYDGSTLLFSCSRFEKLLEAYDKIRQVAV